MSTPSQIGPRVSRSSAIDVVPGPSSAVRQDRRRRRPTGARPPLPKAVGGTGKVWLVALVALLGWLIVLFVSPAARRLTDRVDSAVLRQIARQRTDWLTDVMTAIDRIGTGWNLTVLAIGTILLQMVFRRWRHLFTFLASIVVLELVGGDILYRNFPRPRPYDVTAIGRWAGYSFPSPPVGVLAAVLVGVAYALVPAGRARRWAKVVIAAVLGVLAFARLYLGVDHPF